MKRGLANSVLAIVVAATLVFGACSQSSDSSGRGDSQPQTEEAAKEAAVAFGTALFSSDPDSFNYLSAACKQKWGDAASWGANVAGGFMMLKAFTGVDPADGTIGDPVVVSFAPDKAKIDVPLNNDAGEPLIAGNDDGDDGFDFIYENGAWRIDDCEAIGDTTTSSSGDDDGPGTTVGGELAPAGEATEAGRRADATTVAAGETATSDDGVAVTVSGFAPTERDGTKPDETIFHVNVRVENRSGDDISYYSVIGFCSDGTEGHFYSGDFDSPVTTLDPNETVPSGSFAEGTVAVSVVTPCDSPVVRVSINNEDVDVAVPADVL